MEEKIKILLVDDDRALSPMVREYLEAKEYDCSLFHNAFEALKFLETDSVDLCILDIKMPVKDGFELAREIRMINPEIPFIFLTGENEKEDRIRGLEAGADDYITKPFSMHELELRVKAILRRYMSQYTTKAETTKYSIGIYEFDPGTRELKSQGEIKKLSSIESKLLLMFCQSHDWIIERDQALKKIWDDENSFRERSLNVYISKLRQYLKEDASIEILNIHGSGYKLLIR